jgi:hypothetical protein
VFALSRMCESALASESALCAAFARGSNEERHDEEKEI